MHFEIIETCSHGTDRAVFDSIYTDGFKPSIGEHHWLSDGVYFFTNDFGEDSYIEHAKQWAIANAWDKLQKTYKYAEYCIILVDIRYNRDELFDLNDIEDMKIFHVFSEKLNKKLIDSGVKVKDNKTGTVLSSICKYDTMIKVIKQRVYIKFEDARIYNIIYSVPNCAILCVKDESRIFNIKLLKCGEIK